MLSIWLFEKLNAESKQYKNHLRIDLNFFSVHEEINSKMWYTLCNPLSVLCKGVYHFFEFLEWTKQKIMINPYKIIPN